MFQKPAVRSRYQIVKGLLSRAYKRSEEDGKKMRLLIEWRLAACRHANKQAIRNFDEEYKVSEHMRTNLSTGSRGLDAFNWLAVIEGRNEHLEDSVLKKRIEDMERMHHMVRFFKNSEIKVDLDALHKAAYLANPQSPILVSPPVTEISLRSHADPVYSKVDTAPIRTGYSYVSGVHSPIASSAYKTRPPNVTFH